MYQIITDSGCDLPVEKQKELGLQAVSLTLLYKGQTLPDCVTDETKAFYDGLRAGEEASTAAVNPDQWEKAMELSLQEGKDVLVVTFSSGLSTTYQSAVIAADELAQAYPDRKIRVVDSLCASLGQGLLLYYACQKRDAGMELDALADWLEEAKFRLCHWFTVDDLMYLKRGGRVSAATALVGTMLKIKPVLHVDNEGHLISKTKARGRKAAIDALADKVAQLGQQEQDVMFICHGDCIEDALALKAQLQLRFGVKEVYIGYTGAVIGSHSGPGTLALFFLGDHR